ncbi:unnamed protein product [Caenorhabditis brenneri]
MAAWQSTRKIKKTPPPTAASQYHISRGHLCSDLAPDSSTRPGDTASTKLNVWSHQTSRPELDCLGRHENQFHPSKMPFEGRFNAL